MTRPFRIALIAGLAVALAVALLAQSASAACPNEAIREEQGTTTLPECRAYEMVTPPYKEGFALLGKDALGANGERFIYENKADLAGSTGSGEFSETGNIYLASRTASGWSNSPLNPPTERFVGQNPVAFEPDNGDMLWIQHEPPQPASYAELWVRGGDEQYRRIGPARPDETYETEPSSAMDENPSNLDFLEGATENYNHVVLGADQHDARWNFDETTGEPFRSLYEYSGLGNEEPVLVAVNGPKGSDRLQASCGAVLGSEASQDNALSSDGEAIFFTIRPCGPEAPTAEVWARVHGALTSPLAAETTDVSAKECTVACGAESGKNFEGASEDATQVFFTSTQKLTNTALDGTAAGDAFAGVCAQPSSPGCNLYEYDFALPKGERLRSISPGAEVLGVVGIADDGSRVYYVSDAGTPSAGENPYGRLPQAGQPNLYMYETDSERIAFVATLSFADGSDWQRNVSRPAQVAGKSGRFLLFESDHEGLTPDDSSKRGQLFEYKAEGEGEPAELVRVSKGEDGYNDDGNGVTFGVPAGLIEEHTASGSGAVHSSGNSFNISTDGHVVSFATAGRLSARAFPGPDNCRALYTFTAPTGILSHGAVSLISDGLDGQPGTNHGAPCGVAFIAMDDSGADIFFLTSDALLGSDVDGLEQDVYDARIDGGFGPATRYARCASSGECSEAAATSAPSLPPISSTLVPEPFASAPSTTPTAPASVRLVSRTTVERALRSCRRRFHARHRRAVCERAVRRAEAAAHKKEKS
jgi:hypothetical protein